MNKAEVLKRIKTTGILPVLRAASVEEAVALAKAVEAGGIATLEVTMTVPDAVEVMRSLIRQAGDHILIGAGTVLDPETARACILAGAQFIVSPALNLKTIEICHRYGVAVIPGALTPTEIVTAWEAGADVVKVFRAAHWWGKISEGVEGPLPQIELIPTGGVSLSTAAEFLSAGAFALGVGSDLVNSKAIADGRPEIVTQTAKEYVEIIRKARAE